VNPDDPVIDLVDRTLANLRIIDELARQRSAEYQPFEVTQLVNSLLSLLVVPRELGTVEFVGRATAAPHLNTDGIRRWHRGPVKFELTRLGGKPPEHLKKLLGGLRNSIAHADFRFISASGGAVSAIEFTNRSRAGVPQWSVTFEVMELGKFLVNLSEELKAARSYQVSLPKDPVSIDQVSLIDVEFRLPASTLERIRGLVAAGEATSIGRFLQDAAEAKLLDDEEVTAA